MNFVLDSTGRPVRISAKGSVVLLLMFFSFFSFVLQMGAYLLDAFELQLIIFLVGNVGLMAILIREFGALDPRTIYFVASLMYMIAGPIDVHWAQNFNGYSPQAVSKLLVYGSIFIQSGVVVFFYFHDKWRTRQFVNDAVHVSSGAALGFTIFAVSMLTYYLYTIESSYGLTVGGLTRAEIYSIQTLGPALIRLFLVGGLIFAFWMMRNSLVPRRYVPILIGVFVIYLMADFLVLGDRRIALTLLLSVAFMFFNKRLTVLQWAGLVILASLLLVLGRVRNIPLADWIGVLTDVDLFDLFAPSNLEFGGSSMIASDMFGSDALDTLRPTYLEAFLAAIPKIMLPERPLAPSLWYVSTFYPEVAAIGGGFAFNAVIESLMNFGPIGPLVSGGAVAAGIAALARNQNGIGLLWSAFAVQAFVFFMRSDFVSFLQSFALIGATILFCHISVFSQRRN